MQRTAAPELDLPAATRFWACDQREGRTLPPGLLNDARNVRYPDGLPETRRGVDKPPWANRLTAGSDVVSPYPNPNGAGTFRNPDGRVVWQFIAADGYVWRTTPYNQAVQVPLPTGVRVPGPCTFTQAFNKLFLWRGRYLKPLVLRTLNDGFEDLIPLWDATEDYAENDEVYYGPFQTVDAITRSGDTATVVTTAEHGYVTGADVTIAGAIETEYNGRHNITVVDSFTFTYPVYGAPASPANQQSITSITHVTTTATATKVGHGYSTGQTVRISGATPAAYNGDFVITVTGPDEFTYVMASDPGGNASGTLLATLQSMEASDMTHAYRANGGGNDPGVGESPDTHAAKWTRFYTLIPHADRALFTNNRLLIPTAYTPSSTGYNSAAVTYTKVDFIVATSIQDEIHFDFADEFRINQGSADEIVDLARFTEGVVIVWKGSSWGVLTGVGSLFLNELALDMRGKDYGLSAPGAWAEKGSDIVFMSERRGIVSIRQSESGKLIGVEEPLSAPIQKTLEQVDWTRARSIRMAGWNSHIYASVPLRQMPGPAREQAVPYTLPAALFLILTNLEVGATYRFDPGQGASLVYNATESTTTALDFVATSSVIEITFITPLGDNYLGTEWTGSLVQVVNLTLDYGVLVFSSVSAAQLGDASQGWCPLDTGRALDVLEWFKQPLDGVERLFFLSTDGWVNLMEEADRDRVAGSDDQGLGWDEIQTLARFAPQGQMLAQLLSPTGAHVAVETHHPKYSLTAWLPGVNHRTVLATDVERSNTRYLKPWNAAAWDVTNYNDDHATPHREDYRVSFERTSLIPTDATYNGSGTYWIATLQAGRVYVLTTLGTESYVACGDFGGLNEFGTPVLNNAVYLTVTPGTPLTFTANGNTLFFGSLSLSQPVHATLIRERALYLHDGVALARLQEALHHFRLSGRPGRSVAIELTNTQGRVRLHGLLQRARPGRQRMGIQT